MLATLAQMLFARLVPIKPIRVDPGCICPWQARAHGIHRLDCTIR